MIFTKMAHVGLRRLQAHAGYRVIGRFFCPKIAVRETNADDLLALRQWFNSGKTAEPAPEPQQNPHVTEWVAVHRCHIVGFVQLVRHDSANDPNRGYWLFSLIVKSLYRGLGIGAALSRTVIDRAQKEGATTVDLLVFEDNARAISLYRRLGFEPITIAGLEPELENERHLYGRRRTAMRKHLNSPMQE